MDRSAEPVGFEVAGPGAVLSGEGLGEGPPVVLLHGLTATRRYVVHRSRLLPRRGYRLLTYDARGHGTSSPARDGYGYEQMAADLGAVLDHTAGDAPAVLAGHSMGAHTAAAFALAHPDRVAALVAIGPATVGAAPSEEVLAYWDRLAEGLESGGVEGFIAAYDHGLDPAWRDTLLRITRERIGAHRHPDAVARALQEVPRSRPFDDVAALEFLHLPVLVIASHDEADPGHPYAVAAEWAQRLPSARLRSEEPGQSPLAWQGGRLSREIAAFCEGSDVRERLGA